MRALRLFSNRRHLAVVACVAVLGLGVAGLAGARWLGVYPTSGLVATRFYMPPPQPDWINGPLVARPSILTSTAAAARSIGGNFPNIAAAGIGTPNRIEVSKTRVVARRSMAMRFGGGSSLYWVTADASPGVSTTQMRDLPRQCGCGGVVSLGSTVGVLLRQTGAPLSVTWLDGTGYRWSVIVPPDSPTTGLQVERLARSLVAEQAIKAP